MRQNISIVRGTTMPLSITVTDADGEPYELQSGEKLLFGVKKDVNSSSCIISKELTSANYSDGAYQTSILPNDTGQLEFGRYFYDVGLKSGSNYYNVIEYSEFCILPNITSGGT